MRRVAILVLEAPGWSPPQVDARQWRLALAEDMLDEMARLVEVDVAVAVRADESGLAADVGWPGLHRYAVDRLDVATILAAAAADGYAQAALLAADAPDLPGLLIAKLLRPLTSRPLAAAPALGGGAGLVGLGSVLPAPPWLPATTLDEQTPQALRKFATRPTDVAPASGWHRLRTPEDLARLDPRVEGWDATRLLLAR
jgi:glycosyltransferase A (GT-A) superfamily protein (DUF2064 family)